MYIPVYLRGIELIEQLVVTIHAVSRDMRALIFDVRYPLCVRATSMKFASKEAKHKLRRSYSLQMQVYRHKGYRDAKLDNS